MAATVSRGSAAPRFPSSSKTWRPDAAGASGSRRGRQRTVRDRIVVVAVSAWNQRSRSSASLGMGSASDPRSHARRPSGVLSGRPVILAEPLTKKGSSAAFRIQRFGEGDRDPSRSCQVRRGEGVRARRRATWFTRIAGLIHPLRGARIGIPSPGGAGAFPDLPRAHHWGGGLA
jgi:hypothetical protein